MSTEIFYMIMVGILFLLAVSDLIVGVSNDAINFLNSAIGSRAARLRTVMIVAMIGIIIGAVFSSGMMEVSRKGIFNPQFFYFRDLMIIFISVIIVDVVLLDTFNSFGLPTSTTVSMVFELLGGAVAVALAYNMKGNLINLNGTLVVGSVNDYINNKKAFEIIMSILLSIAMAFTFGALIQYICRIIFTFNYKKVLPWFGGIFSGIAFTAIIYFMLIKGAKDASFMTSEVKTFIHDNAGQIILLNLIVWTVVFQVLAFLIKEWILKIVVLAGTFALAMAFAGNDLVNFIGVSVAGLNAFTAFTAGGGVNPSTYTMEALLSSISTEGWLLAVAGIIMAIALWTSKKAKKVINTTLDLTRQNEGDEQFSSNLLARTIVRVGRQIGESTGKIVPSFIKESINKRFEMVNPVKGEAPVAFDLVRASVILIVSSALIAFGTSNKLPLSTTYVTFMTAMGASFADRSWGRESAVYRISGVLNVIGGWFITAFAAFTGTFIVATIIYHVGIWASLVFIAIAMYTFIRSNILHRRKLKKDTEADQRIASVSYSGSEMRVRCISTVHHYITEIDALYKQTLTALFAEKRKTLNDMRKASKETRKQTQELKQQLPDILKKLEADAIASSYNYVQIVENLNELAYTFNIITKHAFEHVDNNHKEFSQDQIEDLTELICIKDEMIAELLAGLHNPDDIYLENMHQSSRKLIRFMDECVLRQIKRVKAGTSGKRSSMLFMNIISETKNLISFEMNMLRAHHQFMKTQ